MICSLNKTQYDEIIPLGEECYTCMTIDKKFNGHIEYRKNAYPFDYVGHTFIHKIYDKLTNNDKSNIIIKQFGNKFYYYDNTYGFCYWHDTNYESKNDFTDINYDNFMIKYNKRYERLHEKINSNKKLIYLTVQHYNKIFNNEYKNYGDVLKLYNYLNEKNNNILFISINYTDKEICNNNFYHFCINHNKNNNFNASKIDFENKLNLFIHSIFFLD
jgi:hypothetical protein